MDRDDLWQRLERLEREVGGLRRSARRWKQAALAAATLPALALLLGAAARPSALRASSLTIDGPRGHERLFLGVREGRLGVFLLQGDKARVALVSQSAGTSALVLRAPDGGHGVIAEVEADGTAKVITRHDRAESTIGVAPDGRAAFHLADRDGDERVFAVLSTDGTPGFQLSYAGGDAGFYGTVDPDGARIGFIGSNGSGFTTGVTIDGEEASEDLTPGGEGD